MSQYQQRIGPDRRVHQRFDDLRASLVQLGGNNNGIVLNISEGGMAVLFAEEVDVNTLRALRFQAPEFEHWMDINAEVAWISGSRKQAGIRFKELSETARTQLRAGISIATTRARRANQSKQTDGPTEVLAQVTGSVPASSAAPASTDAAMPVASESATPPSSAAAATTDLPTPLASESATDSSEAHPNSRPEEIIEDKGLARPEPRQPAPELRPSDARPEVATKEKAISAEESNPDTRPQLNSADSKPQKNIGRGIP
jgi:hypothetical protein